jgi:hypothetical protein
MSQKCHQNVTAMPQIPTKNAENATKMTPKYQQNAKKLMFALNSSHDNLKLILLNRM